MTPTRRLILAAAALGLGRRAGARRPAAAPPVLSAEDKALVDKATAYIQTLGSAKGRFVQTDARGTQTQGDFYLQRPGKARFAYDGPKRPAGRAERQQRQHLRPPPEDLRELSRSAARPWSLLLAREVRLDRGVTITGVRKLSDGFTITAVDGRRQTLGRIALDFSNEPALLGWTVTDVKGGETRVRLVDFEKTSGLDPKLFVLTDPRRRVGKP